MSNNVQMAGPIAVLPKSGAAVFFSASTASAGTYQKNSRRGTTAPVTKLQNKLEVAFWGEDNRFPQNIENQMAYCGVGKAALAWKARTLYGGGIIPGRVTGQDDDGNDIFTALNPAKEKAVYKFIRQRSMFRFWMEFLLDWTWYGNCFPEAIFSKDGKGITGWVHQESCDARFKQQNSEGVSDYVYLSKVWGASADQFAKFDPKKVVKGLLTNNTDPDLIDESLVKKLDCIDMYNALESAQEIAEKLRQDKKLDELKSAILPVNYPSINKTYYQVPAWDGARLAGWVEIASKIPALVKTIYNKAFRLRYHIEIPENYFERKFGIEAWAAFTENEQKKHREDLVEEMDNFLSSEENAFKSFISFFEIGAGMNKKEEYGRIKITEIPDSTTIEKELLSLTGADNQILVSMGVPPNLFGSVNFGTGQQRSGGSDKREDFLIYGASLNLERQVFLEPLYLTRDFNGWDEDIEFRIRDTVLTTLDTGAGTKKVVS